MGKRNAAALNWDDVRVFASVARCANVLRGAQEAGLDRSTATRRIAALERSLGARLFLRTRDGLRLTSLGERLRAHGERMAAEARELEQAASDTGGEVRGRVRLATTESIAVTLLRRGLLDLTARYPGLELEVLGSNAVLDLTRGEADLALRITKPDQPSLRVRRVARLGFAAFAGEPYVRRRGRPRSERELAGHHVLLLSGELAKLPETRWLAGRPDVQVALRTNSVIALLTALADGAGISVIAGNAAETDLQLVRLFELPALPQRPLYLAMHPDAAARAAVRVVADPVSDVIARARTLPHDRARR